MTIAALPETEAVARQIDPAAIDFLLVYAEALHRMGTPAHRLESELAEIAERLKVPAQFLSTPTSIQAAFGMLGEQHTTMLRMKPGATELGRLAELDAIGGDVFHSVRSPSEATRAVQALVAAPARFPLWAAVLADTAASAAAGRIFSTSPVDVLFGALAGLVVGLVRVALHGDPARSRLMVPLGAFGASFVAMLAASAGASPTIVTVSGILGLLPGFALTTAMTELGTGNLVSGTARAAGALVVLLELAFGVVLAQQLGAWLQVPTGAVHPALATALPGWTEGVALVAMIGGLHVLFQARPQDLRWVAAGAVVAYVASVTSVGLVTAEAQPFVGAFAVAVFSNAFARAARAPASIPMVPGILLLVPGSLGFRGVSAMLEDAVTGMDLMFRMTFVAVALASGVLVANVVVPPRRAL